MYPVQNNQVYLLPVQIDFSKSNGVAKNLPHVSKCLQDILDKFVEMRLTFYP